MRPGVFFNIFRYSAFYYLLAAALLFWALDREEMRSARYYYLAGIAKNQNFENDLDNLLFMEYGTLYRPKEYEHWARLGIGYFNLGDYRKAESFFKKALSIAPDSSEAQYFLKLAETWRSGKKPDPSRVPISSQ